MGLLDNWNKNKFSIYKSEEKTVLKLIESILKWIEEIIKGVDGKTDLFGDHKGSWQGLNKPTLSEEGMRATVEQLNDETIPHINSQLKQMNDNIPYEVYDRTKVIDMNGKYKHYKGFSNFSKRTYGRYEQATVTSIIANRNNPTPQILGTDTKGLGTYTNRDSVALYLENTGSTPILEISTGVTYTNNTATIPSDVDISNVKVGMIIDVGDTINSNWCVGIIKEINGNVLTMEDGFYQVRNDGTVPLKVIPTNGLKARIQWTNKVWAMNSNLIIEEGCPAGTNLELGVLSYTSNINDVGGIDLVNMRKTTHFGIKVRGSAEGFLENYISMDTGVHFSAKNKNNYKEILLRSEMQNGDVFYIANDGTMTKEVQNVRVFENGEQAYSIQNIDSIIVANVSNFEITMPKASENIGRVITVLSFGSGNTVNAKEGDNIFSINNASVPNMSIAKTEGNITTYKFVSGGNNLWYQIQ